MITLLPVWFLQINADTDIKGFLGSASSKEHFGQCRRLREADSIPGLGRSPGVGNGNPLWYSYLENFMDRGAWQATVHDVSKSQTQLSDLRAQGTDPSWGLGEELPNEMTQAL